MISTALIHVSDQLVLSANQSEIPNLVSALEDLNFDLSKIEERLEKAKDDVGLLDKINIFSKSETEKKRDQLKKEAKDIRWDIKAKEDEIKLRLNSLVPEDVVLGCLLAEIEHASGLVNTSTNTALETANHIKKNIRELNRQAQQHGFGSASTQAVTSLLEDLDLTRQANKRVTKSSKELMQILQSKYQVQSTEFRLTELIDKSFQALMEAP